MSNMISILEKAGYKKYKHSQDKYCKFLWEKRIKKEKIKKELKDVTETCHILNDDINEGKILYVINVKEWIFPGATIYMAEVNFNTSNTKFKVEIQVEKSIEEIETMLKSIYDKMNCVPLKYW